jgi:hypothetical protein
MKASFFQRGGYSAPHRIRSPWPGLPLPCTNRSTDARVCITQLRSANFADHLGFDWVSFSEHHYLDDGGPESGARGRCRGDARAEREKSP